MAKRKASKADSDDRIYKMTELVGSSPKSFADATSRAIARAGQTLRNLDWFEVTELRGAITDGEVTQYQVKLKVGFRLE